MDRRVSDRNVSDSKVSNRNAVARRILAKRSVSARDVSTRDVSDRAVSDRDVSDRDVSDRDVVDGEVSGRRGLPQQTVNSGLPHVSARIPAQRSPANADHDLVSSPQPTQPMSRLAMAGTVAILSSAAGWFYVSWRVLRSPVVDAIGETAGGTLLALLIISFAGALRRSERTGNFTGGEIDGTG